MYSKDSISTNVHIINPVHKTCFEIWLEVSTVLQSPRQGFLFHAKQPVPLFPDHTFDFCNAVKVCMYTLNIMYCLIKYKYPDWN